MATMVSTALEGLRPDETLVRYLYQNTKRLRFLIRSLKLVSVRDLPRPGQPTGRPNHEPAKEYLLGPVMKALPRCGR